MKNKFALLLCLIIILLSFSSSFAQNGDSKEVITGTYSYSASEGIIQRENTFEYRDDCFTRSSFLGCKHLEVLSIQVAGTSISRYGDNDKYEIDTESNADNLVDILEKMNFNDVSTNTYYKIEKKPNSVGVAVGNKEIIQDGKSYTLLAVIPRSAGYKQEWAGNFTIGDGDIHEGFKSARDEILRYVKKYIKDNDISGDLKVWIAGYSRGAAIADMVAGFFAGGGIEYFGEDVSITPEDVYCYTIGTPRTIKNGLDKNIELSVEGNRDEEMYANDTVQEPFNYTKGGTVDVNSDIYKGLRNLVSPRDSFPLLPPEAYGFTYYGKVIDPNDNISSQKEMFEELKNISPYLYEAYVDGNKIRPFKEKTFDIKKLGIVETGKEYDSPSNFFKERLDGVTRKVTTNEQYKDEHYQDALTSFTGAYGLSATLLGEISSEGIGTSKLIGLLACTVLDYSSKCLIEEGRAETEDEATYVTLQELLEFIFEKEIDIDTYTIDNFFCDLTKFISDNEDEPVSQKAISELASLVPEDYVNTVKSILAQFVVSESGDSEPTLEEDLRAYIKACYYGPEPGCPYMTDSEDPDTDPATMRSLLYMLMVAYTSADYPEVISLIYDDQSDPTGHGLIKDVVDIVLQKLMVVKDDEGEIVEEFESFSEAADVLLENIVTTAMEPIIEKSEDIYGEEYKAELENQVSAMCDNITVVREFIAMLFFSSEDGYSIEKMVTNSVTFVDNIMQVVIEHFDEVYLAKARTAERYEEHVEAEPEEVYHTVTFKLNGGSFEDGIENIVEVLDGETVSEPKAPTKKGYKFCGWYTSDQHTEKVDFSTAITEDVIFCAKWQLKSSGGSSSGGSSKSSSKAKEEKQETVTETTTPNKVEDSSVTPFIEISDNPIAVMFANTLNRLGFNVDYESASTNSSTSSSTIGQENLEESLLMILRIIHMSIRQ